MKTTLQNGSHAKRRQESKIVKRKSKEDAIHEKLKHFCSFRLRGVAHASRKSDLCPSTEFLHNRLLSNLITTQESISKHVNSLYSAPHLFNDIFTLSIRMPTRRSSATMPPHARSRFIGVFDVSEDICFRRTTVQYRQSCENLSHLVENYLSPLTFLLLSDFLTSLPATTSFSPSYCSTTSTA